MKVSIITPTLQRESLKRCCESVSSQSFQDWEHIVMADVAEFNYNLLTALCHPNRTILKCDHPHNNFGNTCRHNAWLHTTGDYILYLDDDNSLFDQHVLRDVALFLEDSHFPPWGLFPILRHGHRFYTDPPRCCHVDTANVVVSRDIGRWPDRPEYTIDGIWVEELVSKYPYLAFPNFRPIVVMEKSNEGK